MNSSEDPRLVSYRSMIGAFNSGDLSLIHDWVAEDLVYTIPGRSRLAGQTLGLAAHLAVLRKARELSGGTLRLTPLATALDGDYLLIWGHLKAERLGRSFSAAHGVMYRFEGSKVVEGRTIPTDLYAFDAFWEGD